MAGRLYYILMKIEQNSKTIELSKNDAIQPKAEQKAEEQPVKRQPTLKKIWDKNGRLVTHPALYEVCARHQAEDTDRYFARHPELSQTIILKDAWGENPIEY